MHQRKGRSTKSVTVTGIAASILLGLAGAPPRRLFTARMLAIRRRRKGRCRAQAPSSGACCGPRRYGGARQLERGRQSRWSAAVKHLMCGSRALVQKPTS
jgi:hypothetical protein